LLSILEIFLPKITYKFIFENKRESKFTVDLDRKGAEIVPNGFPDAEWTNLDFNKCSNCPLKIEDSQKCPPALDVQHAMSEFHSVLSTETVQTYVETENRAYFKECDAQTALKALVGLVMATSSCPILKEMKGMAYYHLPFASLEETVYRSISTYLLKQYFKSKQGEAPDWNLEHLPTYYEQIQIVNDCFFERIKVASKADANLNVIVSFSSQSQLLSLAFDEYLEILKKQLMDC
jgi:hypothetical protein